jgi:hypothetical protein
MPTVSTMNDCIDPIPVGQDLGVSITSLRIVKSKIGSKTWEMSRVQTYASAPK